jgi:hypothetical protein
MSELVKNPQYCIFVTVAKKKSTSKGLCLDLSYPGCGKNFRSIGENFFSRRQRIKRQRDMVTDTECLNINWSVTVADGGMGKCVGPEEYGVTMRRGAERGPGPPGRGQDKLLICNSGRGETPVGEPGGQQDGSDATSRTHHAQSM